MKNYFYLVAFFMCGFVYAQENTEPELWITYEYTAKTGMNQKFESGVEKKTKMYNSKEGQLRFYTFRITAGPNMDKYFRVRYEDNLKGFDTKPTKEALKMWNDQVGDLMTNSNGRWFGLNKNASNITVSPFSKPLRRVMELDDVPLHNMW